MTGWDWLRRSRFAAGVVLAVMAIPTARPAVAASRLSVQLKDTDGRLVDPFAAPPTIKALVFLFTTIDCPISNRYAPLVTDLNRTFSAQGVQFWLVYPNPFDTPEAIRKHGKDFAYTAGALLDPDHVLAKLAKASVTPEAAVYDRSGRELYRGRIDDRYISIGVERPAPTRHDLQDAIAAVLAGRPVSQATTQAVGCFIADFVK